MTIRSIIPMRSTRLNRVPVADWPPSHEQIEIHLSAFRALLAPPDDNEDESSGDRATAFKMWRMKI